MQIPRHCICRAGLGFIHCKMNCSKQNPLQHHLIQLKMIMEFRLPTAALNLCSILDLASRKHNNNIQFSCSFELCTGRSMVFGIRSEFDSRPQILLFPPMGGRIMPLKDICTLIPGNWIHLNTLKGSLQLWLRYRHWEGRASCVSQRGSVWLHESLEV